MNDEFPSYFSITPAPVRYDERLTDGEKILYGEITALANKDGYCYATNGYFARLYKRTESTISVRISNLQKFGYINVVIEDNYRRRIYIEPLSKNLKGVLEKSKGGIRKIEKGVLEKSKDNNTSINNKLNSKNQYKNNGESANEDFEVFWREYPKHKGKPVAEKAFAKAIRKIELEVMLEAIRRQKQSGQWRKDNGQYIPYPATWLNQERWNDEPDDCMGNGFYHPSHGKNDIHSGLAMALDLIAGSEDG